MPRGQCYMCCRLIRTFLPERQHSPVYVIAWSWGALNNNTPAGHVWGRLLARDHVAASKHAWHLEEIFQLTSLIQMSWTSVCPLRGALQRLGLALLVAGSSHTHLLHQLKYSLPAARLFRLPDVVHGLSASATACDSRLLCYCVCHLADPVSPRPLQRSTHLQVPAPLPPCHPASSTSAASLYPTVGPRCYLLHSLSRHHCEFPPNAIPPAWARCWPLSLPSSRAFEMNSFNHLPVSTADFGSYKQPSKNCNGRENWKGKGAAANTQWTLCLGLNQSVLEKYLK